MITLTVNFGKVHKYMYTTVSRNIYMCFTVLVERLFNVILAIV